MDETPKLSLPFILPNQAQKHVTANEAFQRIDTLAQLSVVSAARGDEPAEPQNGDAYILPDGATGALWSQYEAGTIAMSYDGGWQFVLPYPGWRAWDQDTQSFLIFSDGAWTGLVASSGDETSVDRFGVNTDPDENNRFAVKSDFELLSHDDVTPGSGSARKVINKAAPAQTASVIFQTAFSARAEMGLTGNDDFSLRTSPDGVAFQDAARFDRTTGRASFPSGMTHAATGKPLSTPIFTPGARQQVSIFGSTLIRDTSPRSVTFDGANQNILTVSGLNSSFIFMNIYMRHVSLIRIWNVSKTPASSAWVIRRISATSLEVLDPSSIADWQAGDTIQVGDPEDITPGGYIALDISPMLENIVGGVFPQSGIIANISVSGVSGAAGGLHLSPDGSEDSFAGVTTTDSGAATTGQVTIPTHVPSPVSNSNLVFLRESGANGRIGLSTVFVSAVYT